MPTINYAVKVGRYDENGARVHRASKDENRYDVDRALKKLNHGVSSLIEEVKHRKRFKNRNAKKKLKAKMLHKAIKAKRLKK